MARTSDSLEGRLERVTAQLEQAAKQHRGVGLAGALKPFVLGALLGAGVALLYAPQRGEETRAALRRNAEGLPDRAMQAASSVQEQLPRQAQDGLAQAKVQTKTVMDRGKETLQAPKSGAKRAAKSSETADTNQAANGVRGAEAQAQLRSDLKTGRENPV